MWVQIKATSDSIEIELDKNRPTSFASKEAELEWDRASAQKALRFIDLVESGQYIPPEIVRKIEEKSVRTPEEEQILKQFLQESNRREKVGTFPCHLFYCHAHEILLLQMRWLRVEKKLVDLNAAIRLALHHQDPDIERCVSLIDELDLLAVQPLMLKKLPDVVSTIRKVRKYTGPRSETPNSKVINTNWKL